MIISIYLTGRIEIFYDPDLSVFFDVFDVVFQITEIKGVRVVNALDFFAVGVNGGIGALIIVFTVDGISAHAMLLSLKSDSFRAKLQLRVILKIMIRFSRRII